MRPTSSYGFCECGCGQKTPIATRNDSRIGLVKGEPRRFIQYHNSKYINRKFNNYIVIENGCWIWQGALDKDGYGITSQGVVLGLTKSRRAHVVFYTEKYGQVPEGLVLDHFKCDNKSCCNPEHVIPKTTKQNSRRGVNTKLTEEEVMFIKKSTKSSQELSKMFDVNHNHINSIRAGRRWA